MPRVETGRMGTQKLTAILLHLLASDTHHLIHMLMYMGMAVGGWGTGERLGGIQ
jgi:hypothetical protein